MPKKFLFERRELMTSYPVAGRDPIRNRRIAGHEIGHALLVRAYGNSVLSVSIIPDAVNEGRCVRAGPASELAFDESASPSQTHDQVLSICERLERLEELAAEELGLGTSRGGESIVRLQHSIVELLGGQLAELLLFPDLAPLGAVHDFVEATAFAKVAVAASPSVEALINYCESEARALLTANRDIIEALVEALVEAGTLDGEQVDTVIARQIALRSIETERQRRDDWRRCELSAAEFLKANQET
jgi:hypothetical protein